MDSVNRDLEAAPAATRTTTFSSSTDDPIKQWESALNVVIAANRFKDRSPVATAPPLDQDMGQNTSDYEEISSKEQNLLAHVPEQADTSDEHPSNYDFKLAYLKIVHGGLVQQLNAYGIVFTLLATVTSVSILQPPGSFDGDHGHIRPSKLVACYLLFASLSFLLACTGLFAVIVGQASLYRPLFFPKPQIQPALIRELTPQRGFDKVSTLKSIIVDNLSRVRRLKTYLGFSLALGMTVYVCGAFAILGPGMRNLCMAAGTVGVSIVILLMEAAMTWRGPALPDDTLGRLQHIIH